jgi:hypothetical protein
MIRRMFSTPLRAATAAAVVTGAIVGGVGFAFASIPDGSGVIHGCYQSKGKAHTLKVIDTSVSANCPSGYKALNWNQTGPQGPQGPAGPSNLQLITTNGGVSLSLSAQHCAIVSLSVGGIAVGDTGILAPDPAKWPAGLTMMPLRSTAANKLPADVCNPTSASVSVSNVSLTVWRIVS